MGVILLAFLFLRDSQKPTSKIPEGIPNARVVTKGEIQKAIELGKRQRAARKVGEAAVRLNRETGLVLPGINPGGCIPGTTDIDL